MARIRRAHTIAELHEGGRSRRERILARPHHAENSMQQNLATDTWSQEILATDCRLKSSVRDNSVITDDWMSQTTEQWVMRTDVSNME